MRTSRLHAAHELQMLTNPAVWLCALAAAFTMATAKAATSPDELNLPANAAAMTPQQAYQHDRAYCTSGQATENRSLCLKEAQRAYREARAGRLDAHPVREARGSDSDMARTSTSGTSDAGSMGSTGRMRNDRH